MNILDVNHQKKTKQNKKNHLLTCFFVSIKMNECNKNTYWLNWILFITGSRCFFFVIVAWFLYKKKKNEQSIHSLDRVSH